MALVPVACSVGARVFRYLHMKAENVLFSDGSEAWVFSRGGAHTRSCTIIAIVDAGGECGSGITVFVLYGACFTRAKAMVRI